MSQDAPYHNLVWLRKSESLPGRYDVEIQDFSRLQHFDRVECHIVVYPYSRRTSSDDIHFNPFEEYVQDVLSKQRSAYAEIRSAADQVFGLLLGLAMALIAHFAFRDLRGIEAVVSVFAAYAIGKELWNDIENMLIRISKQWRLSFQEGYYRYQLEKRTTLTSYSYLAKRRRYGKQVLLPEKIDFIKQSNSQTLRMCFNMRELAVPSAPMAHLFSIQIEEDLVADFEEDGYMFGVKLSFAKRFLGLGRQFEVFQSLDAGRKGCLDGNGIWRDNAVFRRKTFTLGRLKYYGRKTPIPNATIIAR
jgi:hypothetical protein